MPRTLLACSLLLLALAGCACRNPHCHGGRLILEHACDATPETKKTPYAATYVLYHWRTPPKDGPAPPRWIAEEECKELYVRSLDRGDKIGFEKKDDKLFAVAGGEKIELEPGRYCWHISPATQLRGVRAVLHDAYEAFKDMVALIIGVPVGIVALILLLPFFILFFPFLVFIILCGL